MPLVRRRAVTVPPGVVREGAQLGRVVALTGAVAEEAWERTAEHRASADAATVDQVPRVRGHAELLQIGCGDLLPLLPRSRSGNPIAATG